MMSEVRVMRLGDILLGVYSNNF